MNILAEPKWAAYSAAALWAEWGLNAFSDAGDFLAVSRRVNLGSANARELPNGWGDRRTRYAKAKAALS